MFTHHAPHEPGEGESGVLAVVHAGVVEVTDVNLHGSVILGLDEAVGPAALARDVEVDGLALVGDPGAPGRVTMLTLEMFFNVFFIIECGLMIIAYGFAF